MGDQDESDRRDPAAQTEQQDERPEQDAELARVRSLILARRARFVAAALAGVGISSSCASPTTCLDLPAPHSAQDAGEPGFGSGTRLDAAVLRPNSKDSGDPSDDADAGADAADGSAPRVCLFIE